MVTKMASPQPMDPQPLGPKKTLFVMVTVVGCIAVLWPKIFHPMLFNTTPKPNVIKDHRGSGIRQERPPHLRADGIHPAMRERGRAIHPSLPTIPITGDRPHVPPINAKIIDGRPGPIPGMRPPMGAGSHQQPNAKTSSMGFIMPLYTIGIVAFFIYTIMKLVCKKSPTTPYEPVKPDQKFREKVFESPEQSDPVIRRPDDGTTKLAWKDHDAIVTAIQGIIDAANEHILEHNLKEKQQLENSETQTKDTTTNLQNSQNGNVKQLENGNLHNGLENHGVEEISKEDGSTEKKKRDVSKDRGQVQVLGFELSATCEDHKKWNRPSSPLLSPLLSRKHHHDHHEEPQEEPNPIYIQTPVDADSQILVADTNETAEEVFDENEFEEDPAVVLSGRMTLSLISPRIGSPTGKQTNNKTDSTENLSSGEHDPNNVDPDKEDMKIEVSNIVVMEKMEH